MKGSVKTIETDIAVMAGEVRLFRGTESRNFFEDVLIVSKGLVGPGTVSAMLVGVNICLPRMSEKSGRKRSSKGVSTSTIRMVRMQLEEVFPLPAARQMGR